MNKESEEWVINSVFFFIHSAVMAPLSPSLVSVYTHLLYEAGEDILKKWAMCCIGKITGVTVEGRAVKNVQSGVALGKYPPSKYFIEFRMKFEGIYFFWKLKSDLRIKSYGDFKLSKNAYVSGSLKLKLSGEFSFEDRQRIPKSTLRKSWLSHLEFMLPDYSFQFIIWVGGEQIFAVNIWTLLL